MLRWGPLVALAGCAQLAGIDETSTPPDTQPNVVRLQVERVQVGRDIARGPQDLTGLTASFLVADATAPGGFQRVTPTLSGTDTWEASIIGPVPVQFESPELPATVTRIYDLPSAMLKHPVHVLEHPLPEPAPAGATINVNVALNTIQNTERYELFVVGAWANVGLAAPAAMATALQPGPITLAATNSPNRRLDKITTNDVVAVLRYQGNQLIAHLEVPPFDQTENSSITGAFVATPQDQTLDVSVHQTQAAQRLSTVRPAVGAPAYAWRLRAAPGLDLNLENGPLLHAASLPAPATADPQTIAVTYGNPFAFRPVLTWDVNATRTYMHPTTMMTATLSARLTERAEPSAGLALTHPAGLPDRITANGTVLNIDNTTVMAPATQPLEVSFVTDGAANTMHMVQLIELVPDGAAYTPTNIVFVHTLTPSARIPRDLLTDGSLYVLRASSMQGCYTAAASGDLTQRALPCSIAHADSGVFQVVTP